MATHLAKIRWTLKKESNKWVVRYQSILRAKFSSWGAGRLYIISRIKINGGRV